MKNPNFEYLIKWIKSWYEIEFFYNWKLCSIIYWKNWDFFQKKDENIYFYFIVWPEDYYKEILTDVYKETYRVCLANEKEKIISWISNHKIWNYTIKEIFDKNLYEYTNLPEDL